MSGALWMDPVEKKDWRGRQSFWNGHQACRFFSAPSITLKIYGRCWHFHDLKKKRMRSEQVALAISQMTLAYYFQVFRAGHQYLCWVDTGRMLGTARVRFWCPCSHSQLPWLIDHLLFSSYPDSLVIFTDVQALINSKEKYSPFFMSFSGHILEKLV